MTARSRSRVVDHDRAVRAGRRSTSTCDVAGAGHHVRVGHHALVGVDEAGALDAPRAARRGAQHLDHRTLRAFCTTCELGQRRVGRGDLAGLGRGQAAEDVREAVGVQGVAQRRRTAPAPAPASARRCRRGWRCCAPARLSHGNGVEPSGTAISHATSSTATSETTAPPASSSRCSGRLVIGRRSWVPSQPARVCPSTASAKIATSDTTSRTVAVRELVGDQRTDLQADQHAAEEAAEGQRSDDETLPVSADREDQHEQDQDAIDHMHSLSVEVTGQSQGHGTTSSGAPPRAAGTGAAASGSSTRRPGCHGRLPATHVEQRRDHPGGEAPDQHARGPGTPARSSRSDAAPGYGSPGRPARRSAAGRRARPRPGCRGLHRVRARATRPAPASPRTS